MELKKLTYPQQRAIEVLQKYGKVHSIRGNSMFGTDDCALHTEAGVIKGEAHQVFTELQPYSIPALTLIALAKKRLIKVMICYDHKFHMDYFEAKPTDIGQHYFL